jgi:hypothetical protein
MPIYEEKKVPKSNHYILKYGDWKFGQGNASAHTLHQPPFAFQAPKEKHRCISAVVQMRPTSAWTGEFIFLFIFYFFLYPCGRDQRPHGRSHASTQTGPAFVLVGPTSMRTGPVSSTFSVYFC